MPAFDGLIGEDFAAARGRARDTSRPIMLIGYQDEENLGLGYLSATCAGSRVRTTLPGAAR